MFCSNKNLMQHLLTRRRVQDRGSASGGFLKWLNIWTLYVRMQFFLMLHRNKFKDCLLRLGCYLISSWHYVNQNCISTIGKVLKLNKIYTYKDDDIVEIVRLIDVYKKRGYLYCSLFFFSMNKIITVRQTMLKDAPIIWSLSDNKEFDELMSIKLWNEVNRAENLLEFDF